jgi:hypothetical protein
VSKTKNFDLFYENIKKQTDNIFIVELSFTEKFRTPRSAGTLHLHGSTRNIMWQKERLVNLAVNNLVPDYYNYIAWLDADIIFFNNDTWQREAIERLKSYRVIQLFERAWQREPGQAFPAHPKPGIVWKTLSQGLFTDETLMTAEHGYGWAVRREFFSHVGLYDKNIVGGADTMLFFACFDSLRRTEPWHVVELLNPAWALSCEKWLKSALSYIQGSASFISGDLVHLYHGARHNRQYWDRNRLLARHNYDPAVDICLTTDGIWEWNTGNRGMIDGVRRYFDDRREDDH